MTDYNTTLKIEMMNIGNRTAECIENFSFGSDFDPKLLGYKVERMVDALDCMMTHTKREILNYFTEDESLLMVSLFLSTLVNPSFDPKESLLFELIDAIELEQVHESFDVNPDKIIKKVQGLTSFQAFCITSMCFQYLDLVESENRVDGDLSILKKVFQIED